MNNISRVLWHTPVSKSDSTPKLQLRVVYNRAAQNWYAGLEVAKTQEIYKTASVGDRTVTGAIRKLNALLKDEANGK